MSPEPSGTSGSSPHPFTDSSKYTLPNDKEEQSRLEAQAAGVCRLLGGSHTLTVLSNPSKILDVGCGTGAATRALARLYPSSSVIGVDITPVPKPADGSATPPNVVYLHGDIHELVSRGHELLEPQSFDLVFSRLLICAMKDWPSFVSTCTGLLRPATGRLECQEINDTVHAYPSGALSEQAQSWVPEFMAGMRQNGLDPEVGGKLEGLFRGAGLQDVRSDEFVWPHSDRYDWVEDRGKLLGKATREGMRRAMGLGVAETLKGKVDESRRVELVREAEMTFEVGDSYWRYWAVRGRAD